MSVDQLPPGKARPAKSAAQYVRYEEFIDRQIESTRRTVKIVDVLTALLTIVVGTMGFLLVAAVVEHWLLPSGFNVAVRLLLFALLFTCLTFYSTRKLWPLLRGSINPAYAAQAIEQDNPSLKNSLLNLLLFRQHRDDVTDAVYETLEEQAATRLHRVGG
jgi:CBS domain containing-hemolysin-like protein